MRPQKDGYEIGLSNSHSHTSKQKKETYSSDEIDYFIVYCIQRERPLLIPIELVEGKTTITIYFERKYARKFIEEDYLFEKRLPSLDINTFAEVSSKKTNFCIDCGKPISYGSIRCKECSSQLKKKQTNDKYGMTRAELKEKIRNQSFLSIAKELGVSDNSVRKRCVAYGLPFHKTEIDTYTDEEWAEI